MIKNRFLEAGLDSRLWKSQFGFLQKRGTEDAIFLGRRPVELACARRGGCVSFLALDWKKAFDSINVDSVIHGLHRFGLPSEFVDMVSGLMLQRRFFVEEFGQK